MTVGVHDRHARSLKFLGSGVKVISGTADSGDLQKTRLMVPELILSNNKQTVINSRAQKEMNALTNTGKKF